MFEEEPTRNPPPATRAEAEEEIIEFLIDYTVLPINYQITDGTPWTDPPAFASIIILSEGSENALIYGQGRHIKAWWYYDDMIVETEDIYTSIAQYEHLYMNSYEDDCGSWNYTEFGIISISEDYQQAEVYYGTSGGPICGEGKILSLERGRNGQWEVVRSEIVWVS
jgi:hypothetical protein